MNDRRDQQLHFRVSKVELERIRQKMESCGILSTKVRSLPAGGSNGEDSVMAPLDFKEANNVRRIGANTIMTMPIHITCLITC